MEKGRTYILVDDVITQGGSINQLKHYIESRGGKVVAVVVMGSSKTKDVDSLQLAMTKEMRIDLESKFGVKELEAFAKDYKLYGGDYRYLTESEARYLKTFKSLEHARKKLGNGNDQIDARGNRADPEGSEGGRRVLPEGVREEGLPDAEGHTGGADGGGMASGAGGKEAKPVTEPPSEPPPEAPSGLSEPSSPPIADHEAPLSPEAAHAADQAALVEARRIAQDENATVTLDAPGGGAIEVNARATLVDAEKAVNAIDKIKSCTIGGGEI
ncbi:hypothetical protein FACS1894205_4380 [Alphaproteobacteria bacterium]|nr:hypothetical protein FACS1894205_4380 [Alphaproteobacteria bacterium]